MAKLNQTLSVLNHYLTSFYLNHNLIYKELFKCFFAMQNGFQTFLKKSDSKCNPTVFHVLLVILQLSKNLKVSDQSSHQLVRLALKREPHLLSSTMLLNTNLLLRYIKRDNLRFFFGELSLTVNETCYSAFKKDSAALIDVVKKWSHFFLSHKFTLITDQRDFSFMLDSKKRGRIKNTKFQLWRTESGNSNVLLFIDLVKTI